jgi:hypothetical protein
LIQEPPEPILKALENSSLGSLINESNEKIQLRRAIELLKDAKRSIFYINTMASKKANPKLDELENATTRNIDKFLADFK